MADEKEEKVSDARYYLESIENCLGELLPNFDKHDDAAKDICDSGSSLLDILEQSKSNLGKVDIRICSGTGLIFTLKEFHEKATQFDGDVNGSNCKGSLTLMMKTIRRLEALISQAWNSKIGKEGKTIEEMEEEPVTFANGSYQFSKACTLVHTQEWECEDCKPPRHYTDGISFKRHQSKTHRKVVQVDVIKSKCRLPHKEKTRAKEKHAQDQMFTHLRSVHGYQKPAEDTYYRGWESNDGGVTWSPYFCKKTDPDPTGPSGATSASEGSSAAPDKEDGPPENVIVTNQNAEIANVEDIEMETAEAEKNFDVSKHLKTTTVGLEPKKAMENQVSLSRKQSKDDQNLMSGGEDQGLSPQKEKSKSFGSTEEVLNNDVNEDYEENDNFDYDDDDDYDQEISKLENQIDTLAKRKSIQIDSKESVVQKKSKAKKRPAQGEDDQVLELSLSSQEKVELNLAMPPSNDVASNKLLSPEKEKPKKAEIGVDEDERDDNDIAENDMDQLLLEDEFYKSSPEADSNELREPLEIEEDSDTEVGDSDESIQFRVRNKIKRYNGRLSDKEEIDVADRKENADFIERCLQFVTKNTSSESSKTSTVSFTSSLLFRHPDSFLRYEIAQDNTFNLSRLLQFQNEDSYLEIKDPSGWITSTAGPDPSLSAARSKEKFKAHGRLREFIKAELNKVIFKTDALSLIRKEKIKENLKSITEDVKNSKTYTKLESQIEANRRRLKAAKETLYPQSSMNLLEANKKYLQSPEFRKRIADCNDFFKTAMSTKKVTARPFNTFANTARHFVMFYDRNRSSSYQFLNSEYMAKREIWFPTGFNESSSFNGLPAGHNFYIPPEDTQRNPDAYIIKVSAANNPKLKMQKDTDIILFPEVHEFLLKYRELKDLHFGASLDENKQFFVSFRDKPLTAATSSKGSILEEFANVNGLPRVTTNTLRGTLEPYIQSSHQMKTRSRQVASHSDTTGAKFYDKSSSEFRASAIHFVSQKEGLLETVHDGENNEEEDGQRAANRKRILEEDNRRAIEKAKETVKKNATTRVQTLGRNCHLLPEHRSFIQKQFSKDGSLGHFELYKGKFPGLVDWKRKFYRIVDTGTCLSDDEWSTLKKIEHQTFKVVRESLMETQDGSFWTTDLDMNKRADAEITKIIRTSLSKYEKNRGPNDQKYFTF